MARTRPLPKPPAVVFSAEMKKPSTHAVVDLINLPRHVLLLYAILILSILPLLYLRSATHFETTSFFPTHGLSSIFSSSFSSSSSSALTASTPPLNIFTLAFNSSIEHTMLDHNCAMLSRTRHSYTIVTDDPTRSYCRVCRCERFVPTHCPCAKPGKRNCRNCEKLEFIIRTIKQHSEFVFLDSDLVLVHPRFADMLSRRSRDFDFLAMYDDWGGPCMQWYRSHFNSGLFFMRRLPHVDYDGLRTLMRRLRTNSDQGTISPFVFKHYERWDTLSLRWHCRFIWKKEKKIPPSSCMTFHDRGIGDGAVAFKAFLRAINRTLLTAEQSSEEERALWMSEESG